MSKRLQEIAKKWEGIDWTFEDRKDLPPEDLSGTYTILNKSGEIIADDSTYYNTAPDYDDAKRIAEVPTDITYLLNRVRKLEGALKEVGLLDWVALEGDGDEK